MYTTDHRSLSRFVSDMLAATGLCLYGCMCQIRCLSHVSVDICVRYTAFVFMEVCVRYSGCHRSLSLWRYVSDTLAATGQRSLSLSRYVSDMLAAIVICLCEDMCQIHWLSQVSVSMEVCVRHAGCHRPHVSMEVCVRYAGCHRYLPLWRHASDTLAATYPMSLSLWRYVSDMLTATGLCLYGGMCTTI